MNLHLLSIYSENAVGRLEAGHAGPCQIAELEFAIDFISSADSKITENHSTIQPYIMYTCFKAVRIISLYSIKNHTIGG
ncbi:MAG: hypothetical protein K0R28_1416, partial [Paenibacillus sp.]|nr:hypothetical protein [Paenibacillus sp.]